MSLSHRSILGKFVIFIAVTLAVSGGAFYYLAYSTGTNMLLALGHSRAQGVTYVGQNLVLHFMNSADKSEVAEGLRSILSTPRVRAAYVVSDSGSILFPLEKKEQQARIDLASLTPDPAVPEHRFHLVRNGNSVQELYLSPLRNRGGCEKCHGTEKDVLGYLAITVSLDDLMAVAEEHRTGNMLALGSIVALLGVMLAVSLGLIIVRPVNKLKRYIRASEMAISAIENGEPVSMPTAPVVSGRDEIADLFRSFSLLITRLDNAYSQLLDVHDGQLRRADQLATIGEMAAMMAHEIKNPIAGIKAALHIFRRQGGVDAERAEIYDEMIAQLDRMNTVIDDLLIYSRMSPPKLQPLDLAELLRNLHSLFQISAERAGVTMSFELDASAPIVQGDEKQLQQVLWNVMLNATQAMKSGGVMKVSLENVEQRATIRIQDTGSGISPDVLSRVFTPFYTTKHKGTGLGMAVSKRIMEQHGGAISIDSTVDVGTTVTLSFPPFAAMED
ncbi:MAG: hypothetical protein HY962_11060 [Ignavibacteriae bacterium]|nr:hypothetical protein [Ignavibacteriota bacterium]